jgi:small conductance mechanosensitive channel
MLRSFGRFNRARWALESRTEQWRQVGLGGQVDRQTAHRAQGEVIVAIAAIVGVLILFSQRDHLFPGFVTEARIATVVALAILGWRLAIALGRGLAPALFSRMEPGTAGTVGFLIRLATILVAVGVALHVAGLKASTLAVGGAFTAVILGLAAQQTIGNLFAGIVLLSTRPFRMGERVRLTGGALAGSIEGIVGSLGLFYTTLIDGGEPTMVPNSMVLNLAVEPLREPERVELRARFPAEVSPADVQQMLAGSVSTPTRYKPHIALEELDRDEVIVRIVAAPTTPADGAKLAEEILAAVRERDGGRPQG